MLTLSLLQTLQSIAKDSPQWRLREAVFRACVDISKYLGSEVFSVHLHDLFFGYLLDPVIQIRDSITQALVPLSAVMGHFWVETQLVPKLQEVFSQEELNYLHRITILKALEEVNTASVELLRPILRAALEDRVPNVRFAACRVLGSLAEHADVSEFKE